MTTSNASPKTPAHILIAEDSPTQAQRLKYILENHGYQVTASVNGRQALELARANPPTLIISDIIMPEMDGYELCQKIKSEPSLKNPPVILVTTLADPQDVIRALECGADNFIVKPYEEHYLLSRIEFVLANYEERENDRSGERDVEIYFNGQRHRIRADRLQILNLLLSTYEAAIQRNQELTRTKEELRNSNAALVASNKELETFSYSVSHDLRAPLRAIDGFSRALLNGYASQLDENGQDLLTRVIKSSERMGQLIEDILNLSRLSRDTLHSEPIDLTALAKAVFLDLQQRQPERTVQCLVAENVTARGDARLLRAALENLLGNAWKFTGKRANPVIEFGATREGNAPVFFIRDNGAGFSMAHADKLFGAFQRLHSTEEFPGTGVGLATVQRIIHRHGGRIWAESTEGVSATFFFTLQ